MNTAITKQLVNYEDKWVAVNADYSNVIASGDSIPEVENKLETMKLNLDNLVITYVTPPDKFLSPNGYTNV